MRQIKETNTAQDAAPIGTRDYYTVELMCCDDLILQEIADPKCTRKIVAKTYALALCSSYPTDFAKVNKAIIKKWSVSALEYIKKLAWSGKCFQDSAANEQR